jgi:predicted ATPase
MNNSLSHIGISNLKSFKEYQSISLAPITLLIGPNNSGKSTMIQAVNILKESFGLDDRNYITIDSFLRTRIKSGGLKDRYGKLASYLNDKDKKELTIEITLEQPWLLDDIVAEFTIYITNRNKIYSFIIPPRLS